MKKSPEEVLGKRLADMGLTLAVAESCTGGLLGHLITNVPGSSTWFKGGVVAYDNNVKKTILKVGADTLKRYGAVSEQVARQMALGVRKRLNAGIGVAVTGIAGPSGGTTKKPVGTVFVAVTDGKNVRKKRLALKGTRKGIKKAAATAALTEIKRALAGGFK